MMYQSFGELFASLAYAAVFGAAFGFISVGISVVVSCFESLISLPKLIFKASRGFSDMKNILSTGISVSESDGRVKSFVKDFLYVLLYGICFGILTYITTDGIFRAYILIAALLSTVFCKKTFGKWLKFALLQILKYTCISLTAVLSLIIMPFHRPGRCLLHRCILPLCARLKNGFFLKKKQKNQKKNAESFCAKQRKKRTDIVR